MRRMSFARSSVVTWWQSAIESAERPPDPFGSGTAVGPRREDVGTWFELLDLEDFVSFGGKS